MNIWPWSTIRKLRELLADAKREALMWEHAQERAWEVADAAIDREIELEDQLAEALNKSAEWEVRYYELQEGWGVVMNDNAMLKRQLAEATKNDTRDPTTGRFVKGSR